MDALRNYYQNYAPRWIKCIRWQDFRERFVARQISHLTRFYIPAFCIYLFYPRDPTIIPLMWYKPQNKEELELIKRNYGNDEFRRNWIINEYPIKQMPPLYDMSERRAKYPEYYGDRYSGALKQYNSPGQDIPDRWPRRPQPKEDKEIAS